MRLSRLGLALSFVLLAISANADDHGAPPEYRIASEDVLQISVWQYAALTRSVRPTTVSLWFSARVIAAARRGSGRRRCW